MVIGETLLQKQGDLIGMSCMQSKASTFIPGLSLWHHPPGVLDEEHLQFDVPRDDLLYSQKESCIFTITYTGTHRSRLSYQLGKVEM